MKTASTRAVTAGDTHQRSVRRVRAEIAARPDCVRPGWVPPSGATPEGGGEEVVVMRSIRVGGMPARTMSLAIQPQTGLSQRVGDPSDAKSRVGGSMTQVQDMVTLVSIAIS